jgi:hypothetical protein
MNHQKDTFDTVFAAAADMLCLYTQCMAMLIPISGEGPHFTYLQLLYIGYRAFPMHLDL